MNVPNFNTVILDADNLTITAGELMKLAERTIVVMQAKTSIPNGKSINNIIMNNSLYMEGRGFTFSFGDEVYKADGPDDVIELNLGD